MMDKKHRRFFAAAAVFIFLFCCFSLHALATDAQTPNEGTGTEGSTVEPPVNSDPPIVDDPTPEPPVSSTPVYSEPSDVPTEPPVSSDPVDSEPSYVETPPPEQSTPEPAPSQSETSEPTIGGTTPIPTPTPRASGGTAGTGTTVSSAKKGSVTRPKKQITASGVTSEAESTEPNYVTFATLNVKNNALAGNLFYSGLGCIAVGVLGLGSLLILFLRNRRYARDEREGIFEEIQQAENRNRRGSYSQEPPERTMAAGATSRSRREEDAPRLSGGQPSRQHRAPNSAEPLVPMDVSMYTEEFSLTEEHVPEERRVPGERHIPQRQTPRQRPSPAPNRQASRPPQPRQAPPAKRYDTEEILREALHRDDDEF